MVIFINVAKFVSSNSDSAEQSLKDKVKAERFSLRFKNLTVLFFIRARPDGKIGDRLASDRDYSGGSLFSVPS